jgi:hypothetical protein
MTGFFCADLHGRVARYETLFAAIARERPDAVFLGGDLLPHGGVRSSSGSFLSQFIGAALAGLRERLGAGYPRIFAVFGPRGGAGSGSIRRASRRARGAGRGCRRRARPSQP